MPGKPDISIPGISQHVIQRDTSRQVYISNDDDITAYVTCLKEFSQQ